MAKSSQDDPAQTMMGERSSDSLIRINLIRTHIRRLLQHARLLTSHHFATQDTGVGHGAQDANTEGHAILSKSNHTGLTRSPTVAAPSAFHWSVVLLVAWVGVLGLLP